jgi:hypothetical protein
MSNSNAHEHAVEREVLLRIEPLGASFSPNIWRTEPGRPAPGEPYSEISVASEVVRPTYIGSIAGRLENKLFVGAVKTNLNELGDFVHTGAGRLELVSTKMKAFIESFIPKKSEFVAVETSLLAEGEGGDMEMGGGAVISGAYWLWNCYNWLDLIDEVRSEREPLHPPREHVRMDLPGHPIQAIRPWGSPIDQQRRLILRSIDYDSNPFFRIIGIPNALFVSPAVADALECNGMLAWSGSVSVNYTELDTLSPPSSVPLPFRVFGSDRCIPDMFSPPFTPRIPSR